MNKKHKYNKENGRDYEYDKEYQSSPEQKKRRNIRNRDRRHMIKKYGEEALEGKDVHHEDGKNMKKPRIISKSKNRGIK